MDTLTKRDLYCNYKWLDKLVLFSDELVLEDKTTVKIILLTRHNGFRKEFLTSKNKFKKISSEHLNSTKNFSLNLCVNKQTMKKWQVDYQVMFVNHQLSAACMVKAMNIMIGDIAKCYFPKTLKGNMLHEYNTTNREAVINKLTLLMSNMFNDEYMNKQYGTCSDEDLGISKRSLNVL